MYNHLGYTDGKMTLLARLDPSTYCFVNHGDVAGEGREEGRNKEAFALGPTVARVTSLVADVVSI